MREQREDKKRSTEMQQKKGRGWQHTGAVRCIDGSGGVVPFDF